MFKKTKYKQKRNHKFSNFIYFEKRKNGNVSQKEKTFYSLSVFETKKNIYLLAADKKNSVLILVDLLDKKKRPRHLFFDGKKKIKKPWKWENIRLSKMNGEYILCYEDKRKINCWFSRDLNYWFKMDLEREVEKSFVALDEYQYEQSKIVYSRKENKISYHRVFEDSAANQPGETDLKSNVEHSEKKELFPAKVAATKLGILLFYYNYDENNNLHIEAAILNKDNPSQVIWKNEAPIWQSNRLRKSYFPLGIVKIKSKYFFYCKDEKGDIFFTELPAIIYRPILILNEKQKEGKRFLVRKSRKNPILSPRHDKHWESGGTFNPAAIYLNGKIHLVYRAVGQDGMSVLGYASSDNGFKISERSSRPIYFPSQPFELVKNKQSTFRYQYMSGGGWGGCEDPRLSIIEDKIFMTYTAFNGQQAPGVALTCINIKDFLNKRWKWKKPRLISQPGKINKNWIIFPEKINGQYAVLHSISPSISIDYFDSLDEENISIESQYSRQSDGLGWESTIRGVGAPPIKTDYGWLILYHAMDSLHPDRYKVGAMLLDYKNPQKILSRYRQPLLEPSENYENDGKPGIVYVCGAIIKKGKFFIYYGGADRVTCLATASLGKILNGLVRQPT